MVGACPASVDPGCACDHNIYGLHKDASLSNMARNAVFEGLLAGEGGLIHFASYGTGVVRLCKNLLSSAMSSLFTG